MLKDRITIVCNGNYFVGMKLLDGVPTIFFPHGYSVSDDDDGLRKDIFILLSVIRKFASNNIGTFLCEGNKEKELPLESYLYIIDDFLRNSYYIEKDCSIKSDTKGKILWKKTISKEKPYIDNDDIAYLKFQTKTNKNNENNIITKIHKVCVYESFCMFGWMFLDGSFMPQKPNYQLNKDEAVSILADYLNKTFNDEKKKLFKSMINIIKSLNDNYDFSNFYYGVDKFDLIWEKMIDSLFGERNKEKYFPHANWFVIKNGKNAKTSALMPDTIMKYDEKIFVLDAKYYRYGIDETNPSLLPQTDSIQKQITYGRYISNNIKELEKNVMHIPSENDVYNAFVMPYKAKDSEMYKFIGIATSDWEKYDGNVKNYAFVVGILVDTKHLMIKHAECNNKEKALLSTKIIVSLEKNKKLVFE